VRHFAARVSKPTTTRLLYSRVTVDCNQEMVRNGASPEVINLSILNTGQIRWGAKNFCLRNTKLHQDFRLQWSGLRNGIKL